MNLLQPLFVASKDNKTIADNREEEDLKEVWPFLVVLCIMYFGAQTTENTFGAFIYDYARCSKNADLEAAEASQVLTLFWAMMMVGRFAGIFISTRISPTLYC